MIVDFIQQRLEKSFPTATDTMTTRAVREGVVLADDLLDTNEILKTLIGSDLKGHIRRAGVLHKMHDFCQSGELPFNAAYKRMPLGSWHFLEIASEGTTAHVHKTDSASAFPKDTPTRQIERVTNQLDFFYDDNVVPFSELLADGPLNAWLTFGATQNGEITHVGWRVPAKDEDVWIGATNVLAGAAKSLSIPATSGKSPDLKAKMRFKKHIEEAIEQGRTSDKQENE